MTAKTTGGIFALTLAAAIAAMAASIVPASAEFFGCKDPHTTVSYSSRPLYNSFHAQSSRHYARDYSVTRTRHAAYSTSSTSGRRYSEQWR